MKELRRYLSYIGKYKAAYWSIFVMTLVTSVILNLLYPYMNKLIFNAMEYKDRELFERAALLCIILVVLNCLAPYRRYFQIKVVRRIVFDIKTRLFEKLMKMDMNFYEKHHSGEVLKTLSWDANSLKDSYFSHIYWVVGRLVNGVTSIIAMMVYSPVLAAVSVSFCLLTVYFSLMINRQIKQMDQEIQRRVSGLTQRLSDILSGFTLLKMYRGATIVIDNFQEENEQVTGEEKQRVQKSAVLEMVTFLLGILASFGTIGVGAVLVTQGKMDYGTVMAVVSLQMGVSSMLQRFGAAVTTLSSSLVKAGRVFDFLELDGEEKSGGDKPVVIQEESVPVSIERLAFAYDGSREILKDFSMRVSQNEKVLLMGESGCGKSTLLKLMLGFYDKTAGRITLYGHDVCEYPLWQLRQMITYIPQNSYLFEGTVYENIAYGYAGSEAVSEEAVKKAAKLAYADEFIQDLPQGYDTMLAMGGSNLSGGQRQRIAIARAFLKDSPILLMDEPSSALDAQSERMLGPAMKELMKQKVVLMVTHRETAFGEFEQVVRL